MAISANDNVLNLLKIIYKDGVQSLLFRNSPVLREIAIEKVEGKELRFASMYGRGGACSSDYLQAKSVATETARNAEWKVTSGQLFSALTIQQKEILASKSNKGAYMTVLGNRTFAALEAERKQLAKLFYGTGYGEFGVVGATGFTSPLVVGSNTITLTEDAIMGIDIGTVFNFATGGPDGVLGGSTNTVTAIDGNVVTFTATVADTITTGDSLNYAGSRDASGMPQAPIGIAAWLPTIANRTGAAWNTYIAQPMFGVNRSLAPDRLAGQFVAPGYQGFTPSADRPMTDTLIELFRKTRRAGGIPDMVIINDMDRAKLYRELQAIYGIRSMANDKGKKSNNLGWGDLALEYSTSFLDYIVEDPYCPQGTFYIIEKDKIAFCTYSQADKVVKNDGQSGNEPGKGDPLQENGTDYASQGNRINVDDLVTIEQGTATSEGPAVVISFNLYGTWAVFNTANVGVGKFA